MTVRKTARWQTSLDERILEHLQDDTWATPRFMACRDGINATESQIRDRCRVLADADLVAFLTDHGDLVELTTWGERYLDGEVDVALRQQPRHPRRLEG